VPSDKYDHFAVTGDHNFGLPSIDPAHDLAGRLFGSDP
jgi:hypothetical protein